MSLRHALGAVVAATLLLSAAPAAGATSGSYDRLTIDPTGRLTRYGVLTLSGSYRCHRSHGPVFVSSSISQRDPRVRHGIGGTMAICDGTWHRWANSERNEGVYHLGRAYVEATLLELRATGLPLPHFHAVERKTITLTRR
ncbi:DUF6299 family protein [Streptomyces sp. NPDC052051]|uniref:DUF6299 family protein n=1 Tax=Streptomyces sp. NPDC052051 TaxID=3154649 RepID=UPI0034192583